jgi:TonB family protein
MPHSRSAGPGVLWRRLALGTGLALAGLTPVAAQSILYTLGADSQYHRVVKISGNRPFVLENGQAVASKSDRFALRKTEEYLPILITISDRDTTSSSQHLAGTDSYLNNQFHFSAKFESADTLEDVFIVLDLDLANGGKGIFAYEIGQLEARVPKPIEVSLPLGNHLGAGQLVLHLFVAGAEVLNSEQPADIREALLDRMIAKRIAGTTASALRPFYGPAPAYPPALRQSGLKGEAVVNVRVTSEGKVIEPVVQRASEAPFGEEAKAAVQQWRFMPRVVAGQAVETRVSIPFAFDPPAAGGPRKD